MRFARNSYITWFLKLSFRVDFRKPFRDLPDTFRDSAFSHFLFFFVLFLIQKKNERTQKRRVPEGIRKVPEEFPEVNPEGQFRKPGDVRVSSKPHIYIYILVWT